MAQAKKKWVSFRTGATIPADVIGEPADRKVGVAEPVQLPAGYADHVVHDRFADFCAAPKKTATKKSESGRTDDGKTAAKAAHRLAEAQKRIDGLKAQLAGMSQTDDGHQDVSERLKEAEAELATLQPAS